MSGEPIWKPHPYREVHGVRNSKSGALSITIPFDPDTFAEIKGLAKRDDVSFSEQVRTLVQWGIEADCGLVGGL